MAIDTPTAITRLRKRLSGVSVLTPSGELERRDIDEAALTQSLQQSGASLESPGGGEVSLQFDPRALRRAGTSDPGLGEGIAALSRTQDANVALSKLRERATVQEEAPVRATRPTSTESQRGINARPGVSRDTSRLGVGGSRVLPTRLTEDQPDPVDLGQGIRDIQQRFPETFKPGDRAITAEATAKDIEAQRVQTEADLAARQAPVSPAVAAIQQRLLGTTGFQTDAQKAQRVRNEIATREARKQAGKQTGADLIRGIVEASKDRTAAREDRTRQRQLADSKSLQENASRLRREENDIESQKKQTAKKAAGATSTTLKRARENAQDKYFGKTKVDSEGTTIVLSDPYDEKNGQKLGKEDRQAKLLRITNELIDGTTSGNDALTRDQARRTIRGMKALSEFSEHPFAAEDFKWLEGELDKEESVEDGETEAEGIRPLDETEVSPDGKPAVSQEDLDREELGTSAVKEDETEVSTDGKPVVSKAEPVPTPEQKGIAERVRALQEDLTSQVNQRLITVDELRQRIAEEMDKIATEADAGPEAAQVLGENMEQVIVDAMLDPEVEQVIAENREAFMDPDNPPSRDDLKAMAVDLMPDQSTQFFMAAQKMQGAVAKAAAADVDITIDTILSGESASASPEALSAALTANREAIKDKLDSMTDEEKLHLLAVVARAKGQ